MQDMFQKKKNKNILISVIFIALIIISISLTILIGRINYLKAEVELYKIISYLYPLRFEDLINIFGEENIKKIEENKIAYDSIIAQCPSEIKSKLSHNVSLYIINLSKFHEDEKYNKIFICTNMIILICDSEDKIIGYYFYHT